MYPTCEDAPCCGCCGAQVMYADSIAAEERYFDQDEYYDYDYMEGYDPDDY